MTVCVCFAGPTSVQGTTIDGLARPKLNCATTVLSDAEISKADIRKELSLPVQKT
jgi:hypothetical protein